MRHNSFPLSHTRAVNRPAFSPLCQPIQYAHSALTSHSIAPNTETNSNVQMKERKKKQQQQHKNHFLHYKVSNGSNVSIHFVCLCSEWVSKSSILRSQNLFYYFSIQWSAGTRTWVHHRLLTRFRAATRFYFSFFLCFRFFARFCHTRNYGPWTYNTFVKV